MGGDFLQIIECRKTVLVRLRRDLVPGSKKAGTALVCHIFGNPVPGGFFSIKKDLFSFLVKSFGTRKKGGGDVKGEKGVRRFNGRKSKRSADIKKTDKTSKSKRGKTGKGDRKKKRV